MKVLYLNHYCSLDIQAMRRARPGNEIKTISQDLFLAFCDKHFPEELKPFVDQEERFPKELLDAWIHLNDIVFHQIYSQFPFELLIVPLDDYYYFRRFQRMCRARGIPIAMVLKEGTIAPFVMEDPRSFCHIQDYECLVDVAVASSSRAMEFFSKIGLPRSITRLSGQPRFDGYFYKDLQRPLEDYGLASHTARKRILFLGYHPTLSAKSEEARRGEYVAEVESMRNETVEALGYFLHQNPDTELIVKCHPQQNFDGDVTRLLRQLESFPKGSFGIVTGTEGVIEMTLASDVVVGYCSTALMEAMVVQKPAIFTFWENMKGKYEHRTLPHHRSNACEVAGSKEQLIALLDHALNRPHTLPDRRKAQALYIREQLGVVDGQCAERAWQAIETYLQNRRQESRQTADETVDFLEHWTAMQEVR